MMEPGRYRARAVEAALGKASTGTEQIAVAFEVIDGPAQGQQITWYGFFTEATLDRTLESLRHCGWSTDDITNLEGLTANEVQIVVEDEEDREGNVRSRVKWVNRPGGIAMKDRMEAGTAAALAKRIKGAAIASRQKSGGSKPPQNGKHRETRAPAKTGTDNLPPDDFGSDDIPF